MDNGRTVLAVAFAFAVSPSLVHAQRGAAVEPPWPAQLSLAAGEGTGFGFVVGQPGRVHVVVQCQGPPITITLIRPAGAPVSQQGTCGATIDVTATPADVQRSVLWGLMVRASGRTPDAASSARAQSVRLVASPVVTGTILVEHPPGDPARASAEVAAIVARAPAMPAASAGKIAEPPVPAERAAEFEREVVARRTRLSAQLRALPLPAAAAPTAGRPMPLERETRKTGGVQPPPAAPQGPVITAFSTPEGQPADPIRMIGSGFGTTKGAVRFVFPPGFLQTASNEAEAPIVSWTDSAVEFAVPYWSGIVESPVQVYVTRTGVPNSKPLPFKFKPTIDTRVIEYSSDARPGVYTGKATGPDYCSYCPGIYYRTGLFFGAKGDDEFFSGTTLKNGWVVDDVYLVHKYGSPVVVEGRGPGLDPIYVNWEPKGGAYITESSIGTATPFIKVHWWMETGTGLRYTPRVLIRGPLGVPFK